MGSSEIWDKYHKCCIGNGENFTRHSTHFQYNKSDTYLSQIFTAMYTHAIYSMLLPYSLTFVGVSMYVIMMYKLRY